MNVSERQLMVREFMRNMGWEVNDKPAQPPQELVDLFMFKLREEVGELGDAAGNTTDRVDFIELVDALRDVEYLLYGLELLFGVQEVSDDAFHEVHYSNMTKSMENGTVTKPTGFKKPRIHEVLKKAFPRMQMWFRS